MGLIHIKERGGDEEYRFKKALKTAKTAIEEICELSDEMEEQYSERGGYHSRSGYGSRDWDGMEERRYRDSRGRYM
ncbi:MAG: hypothetical protein IKW99_03480 [Bacteroidales bacterium]|nr:hypothetical protein [Bacteroidales bacterium]